MLLVALLPAHAEDWSMYLRDPAHSSFDASESLLSRATLPGLRLAWTTTVAGNTAAAVTVAEGTLYFGDWAGNFYAMDARTGAVLWSQYVGKAAAPSNPECSPPIGVSAQATVDGDQVYVGGGDSAVYAFARRTGELLWRVALADPATGSYLWSSLTLYNGALYVGVASLEDCPLARGLLARIDLAAPQRPLIRYLYPANDIGGGVWSTPAIDEATNTVFVTTGTGEQDPGSGRWGSTFAAFDASTLQMKAYYFLPTNDSVADIEWGSSPTLFTDADGTPLVAATGKDGAIYALRREDLSVAWILQLAISCGCPECGCGAISTPAFDGRSLYVGAGTSDPEGLAQGSVYALDPSTGTVLWRYLTDGVVLAPVTVANGLVYVSTTTGLNVFDAASGELVWTDGEYDVLYSQPVIADGVVYCSYLSGWIVAWGLR